MDWVQLGSLVTRLTQGRPGVLGWSGFYFILIGAYCLVVVVLIVQSIRKARQAASSQQSRYWMAGLLMLALLRGVLYSTLNPPWLSPDEPSHFEYARLVSDLQRIPTKDDVSSEVQRDILASMYEFDFWQHNNMVTPEHPPSAFAGGLSGDWQGIPPTFVVNDQFLWYFPQIGNEPPLYYILNLPAFWSFLSHNSVLLQSYWMRWITMLLYVLCAAVTFLVGRLVLKDVPGGAIGAAALVALHPMFGYMGTSVNNDLAGATLGTVWFAVVAMIFSRGWSWKKGVFLLILTFLSFWTKKTVFFLLPLCVFVLGLYYWSRRPLRTVFQLTFVITLVILLAGAWGLSLPNPKSAHADMWITRPTPQTGLRSHLQAYDGSYSFRLSTASAGTELRLAQPLPSSALASLRGQTVVLEAAVRGESADQHGRLVLVDNKGRHTVPFVASINWQVVSLTYKVPTDAQFLRVQLLPGHQVDEGNHKVYFDAVSLRTADTDASNGNFVRNGSAEVPTSRLRTFVTDVAQPLGLMGYVVPWFMQPVSENLQELLPLGADFAFVSFWGRFGSLSIVMPPLWETIWKYASLAALIGIVPPFVGKALMERRYKFYFGVLVAGIVANGLQVMLPLLKRPDAHWLPQGRFLFPVVMPIALLLYLGWSRLLPARLRPWLLPLIVTGAAIMDGVALITLVSYCYYRV